VAGLSPHAPYSTLPELLRLTGQAARSGRMVVSTHVAESRTEYEMFRHGRGEMHQWLGRSGRDMSDCGLGSPVQHLHRARLLGRNLVIAHANYLDGGDAGLLARSGASLVHCPRSHFYFRHSPFAFRRLSRAGVNICLGTDSLATVYRRHGETVTLDMFAEMRCLAAAQPRLSPRSILRMATLNGAAALGLGGCIGELSKGRYADVIVLPLKSGETDLHRAALRHEGPVLASMINGAWAIRPS
jgi:cytosine/adenosine deaminase-related metal-dependent hydrolase